MDIEKICRTCLGLSGPLLSIYDDRGGGGGCIADMLRDFTKTNPRPEDKLPDRVCLTCISEINHCFSFKSKCENSCRTLRQLVPDALPDEPPKAQGAEQIKAEQSNKSVQTQSEIVKKRSTACTQTNIPISQNVQTSPHKIITKNQSVSPIIWEKPKGLDNIKVEGNEFEVIETNKKRQPGNNIRTESTSLLLTGAHKRRNLAGLETREAQQSEIIMEIEAEETEINENAAEVTRFSVLRTKDDAQGRSIEQEITHYELTTADVIEHSENESEQNHDKTSSDYQNLLEDGQHIEYIEGEAEADGEEVSFTRFTYNDEYDESNSEVVGDNSQQSFTIIAVGAEEAEGSNAKSSKKRELKCGSCPMTFVSAKRLAKHRSKQHSSELRKVEKPAKKELIELVKSLENNKGNRDSSISTENVSNNKTNKKNIQQPIVQKTEPADMVYFCYNCGAGFARQLSLAIHTKQNNCTKVDFKCTECKRCFISLATLNAHKETHLRGEECNECGLHFETSEVLAKHMIIDHNRSIKNQCNVCKKVFTMLSALKDHLRIHNGEKPFACNICDKAFSQKTNLTQHLMRHSKEKPFKCPDCDKSFVTKAELDSHQRTHTGARPYHCDECTASFTINSSLVKHKRVHSGERPYACDLCPKRFISSYSLKNHRRVHTGERPFQCRYCSKTFTQRQDCIIHHRTHTNEKIHVCFCGRSFTHLGTLRTHMKTHAGKDGANPVGDGNADTAAAASAKKTVTKRPATRTDAGARKRARKSADAADTDDSINITILNVDDDGDDGAGEGQEEKTTFVRVTECERDISESDEKLLQLAIEQV